jgi:hypothetical protein
MSPQLEPENISQGDSCGNACICDIEETHMHIVQGKRLTGEACIIEYINTCTVHQLHHSQTQVSLDKQTFTGLANKQ